MATQAVRKTRQSIMAERAFYLAMMAAIFLLVVWGFAPSFYLRSLVSPPPTYIDRPDWMSWMFIAHGVLATAWLVLFAAQTVLIGRKQLRLHKAIGQSVKPLYFVLVGTGFLVGYIGARYGFHQVPFDSVTFSALPWLVITVFAILGWAGLHERRDPQRHKRLMLLATIALADAGVARVTMFHGLLPPWLSTTVLLLIPLLVWDLATLRRIHRTTVKGGLLVAGALLLSVPIGMTKPWHAFVTTIIGGEGMPAGKIAD
jgi:FtsH-binding integral membrane protein